jgi:hypothetical protein
VAFSIWSFSAKFSTLVQLNQTFIWFQPKQIFFKKTKIHTLNNPYNTNTKQRCCKCACFRAAGDKWTLATVHNFTLCYTCFSQRVWKCPSDVFCTCQHGKNIPRTADNVQVGSLPSVCVCQVNTNLVLTEAYKITWMLPKPFQGKAFCEQCFLVSFSLILFHFTDSSFERKGKKLNNGSKQQHTHTAVVLMSFLVYATGKTQETSGQ